MPPIYSGKSSHYAKKFGVYVRRIRKKGVDTMMEAIALATMVCFDYHRKKTVNHKNRIIKMSKKLFEKRIEFLKTLAKWHGSPELEGAVSKLVEYCKEHGHPPKTVKAFGKVYRTGRIIAKLLRPISKEGEELKQEVLKFVEKHAKGVVKV